MKTSRQAEHLRYNVEAMRIETVAMNKLCDGDIAFGCQRREQIETLKDEADFVSVQFCSRGIAQFGEVIPVDQQYSLCGFCPVTDYVEQPRLSATLRTHHPEPFTWLLI